MCLARRSSVMKAKRLQGRLSDNAEVIQRAMARARSMAALEPVRRRVNGEHWIFVLTSGAGATSGVDQRACESDGLPGQRGKR